MADARDNNMEEKDREESEEGHDEFRDFEGDHLYEDWDDLATDPEEVSKLGRAIEGLLPDVLKRGVGGLVSEDGIRSLVKDRELPREAVGFILGQADATKREVLRVVSREVRLFLENVDLGGELTKILTSVSFEIRTEVRFIPNDASVKPNVRNRVSIRGQDGEKKDLSDLEEDDEAGEAVADTDEGAGDEEDNRPRRRRRWGLRRRGGGDEELQEEPEDQVAGGDDE